MAFSHRARAFIAIECLLGPWLLGDAVVVGILCLIAAPVMSALFPSLRAARVMLVLVAVAQLLPGWFLVRQWPFLGLDSVPFGGWVVITLNETFVSGMMAFGASVLLGRPEEALGRQRLMLGSLEQSRDALQREIAERRQVEKEHARLAQVVDQSPAAVMIVSPDGSVWYRNRASGFLLVDDEQTILDTTARYLECAGHSVTRAGDGLEGRDLFDADPTAFDLLVTDLTMPGCSGEELIEHVHERRPELPAILTSGFGGHSLMVDQLESRQLVSYLDKPFRQAELLARVEAAVSRHGAAGGGPVARS